MKKLILAAVIAAMVLPQAAMPVNVSAAKNTETISYTYSAGEGKTYTREMEKLGRGLVAIKTNDGVYLSWRLLDSEDAILGSAKKGVSFKVYRDGTEIATVSSSTNYTDSTVGTSYSVAPVVDGTVGEKCTAVSVMNTNYFDIPLVTPETETVDYKYTDTETNELADGTLTYNFFPADCSTGDLDGDGEYEIIVKWTSAEKDVGSPGTPAYSGTVRFAAYKLNGTKMWSQDINLGKNVYSSAHTAQFLVYDFDGDGKAEMMVQTSLGSKDALGNYVSKAADPETYPNIASLTDDDNASADYRNAGWGLITTGDEYLTVFNGETGEAIDTIDLPTPRGNSLEWGDPKETSGNRVNRFMASVAYLDGEKPYAVYSRGYYFAKNAADVNADRQRTSIAGVSLENGRLNPKYRFDTNKNYPGYVKGDEKYAGNGNHNCTVADVDNDGKDEYITGALCMEVDDNDQFRPRWCTFLEHGDALHIGDYDPTHKGFEFFTIHEDGFSVMGEKGYNHYTGTELDYGMSVIDADTGEILFHEGNDNDTGRGIMANIGAGGYYQIYAYAQHKEAPAGAVKFTAGPYVANGNGSFTKATNFSSMPQNFRVFWDGDLYDEILDGTAITGWNKSTNKFDSLLNASSYGCVQINGTKANPALQADLFGDWREEVVYPLSNGSALRVFTTTTPTDYKLKTLMHDPVYRSGVAAEQTAYNQPPHIGFYLDDQVLLGDVITLSVNNSKTEYNVGEELDRSEIAVTAEYESGVTAKVTDYKVSGYDPLSVGEQTLTISYGGKEIMVKVNVASSFTFDENGYITGYNGTELAETIPVYVNGMRVKGIAEGALSDSGIAQLYVYDDPIEFGENCLPYDIRFVCFEGSDTEKYAKDNNLRYELMQPGKYYLDVNFENSDYSGYSSGSAIVYQHEKQAWTAEVAPILYGVGARSNNDGGDNNTGVYKYTNSDNNMINVRAGQFSTGNRHAYAILNGISDIADAEEYTFSFDFNIAANEKNMTIAVLSSSDGKFANGATNNTYVEDANTIYALQAGKDGVVADTWYHYELKRVDGVYSQTITNTSTNATLTPTLNNEADPASLAFPSSGNDRNKYSSAYLDNISVFTPLTLNITLYVKDSEGTAVRNASVTMDGETKVTDTSGSVTFEVLAGKYDVSVTHSQLDAYNTSVIAYGENQSREIKLGSALPSQISRVTNVEQGSVSVYVPEPEEVMIFAAHYWNGALSEVKRLIPEKSYENTFTDVYNTDAVYIWSMEMEPLAIWRGADNLYTVTVTVTDAAGSAAENISVLLSDRGRQLGGDDEEEDFELAASSYSTRMTTDANGVAKFENVPFGSGSYSVFAFKNGVASSNSTSSFRLYYDTNVSLSLTVK